MRAYCARQAPGTQSPTAANYPGLPRERPAAGLVIAIAVVIALAVPYIRLRLPVPLQAAGQVPSWWLRMWTR